MVSFSCENCGDVLTKKKLDPHRNRCRGANFTCIDCMVHFAGTEYRAHTSCISEEQKYQGHLYKNKKVKIAPTPPATSQTKATPTAPTPPSAIERQEKAKMPQKVYIEDIPEAEAEFEDYEDYEDYEDNSEDESRSPAEPLPEAPTPPPAPEAVNVFDFLVAGNTPNASNLNLAGEAMNEETQLVRFDYESNTYVGPEGFMSTEDLVQYGTGPVPGGMVKTPAPKTQRRRTTGEVKTDKKRKRLHVETDQVMTDAPPVPLHSGLTGGLNRMMRPVLPPSPDYSGGDVEPSPASPLKKTKHSKHHRSSISNNLLAMMTSGKTKTKKRKASGSSSKKHKSHSKTDEKQQQSAPGPKLIEYRPSSSDSKKEGENGNGNSQMVVYRPRADLFFSFIKADSERGCSVNKALKRFHRERNSAGDCLGKSTEEKELWRGLRMKRNDRGEIVLFSA